MINRSIIIMALASGAAARPVSASADQGATVGAVVAATAVNSTTEASVSAAVGYRLDRFLGFGVEVTSIPVLKPDVTASPIPMVSGTDGRATVFTVNVRVEISTLATRVIPYVGGGGGVANVKEIFTVTPPTVPPDLPVVLPSQLVTRSSTDLALTAGGGISILVTPHLAVDIDARYLRLIADRDKNMGRFGAGVSWRF